MTDFVTRDDTNLGVGRILTSPTLYALYDNPIAIAEGAAGAPRILGEAIEVIENLPVVTVAAADTYTIDLGLTRVSGNLTNSTNSFVTAFTITINNYTGGMRFRASHSSSDGTTSTLEILKNGAVQQTFTTTSTSPVARSRDVVIAPGDIITWRHRMNTSGPTSTVSAVSESADKRYSYRYPIYLEG